MLATGTVGHWYPVDLRTPDALRAADRSCRGVVLRLTNRRRNQEQARSKEHHEAASDIHRLSPLPSPRTPGATRRCSRRVALDCVYSSRRVDKAEGCPILERRFSTHYGHSTSTLSFSNQGAGKPAPLPLGESGASSVKGGSERRAALLGCPLPRRGGAPAPTARVLGWRRHAGRDFGRILLLSGVSPWMGCPMMGSEGPDCTLREGYVEPDENAHGGLLVSWLNPDRP